MANIDVMYSSKTNQWAALDQNNLTGFQQKGGG